MQTAQEMHEKKIHFSSEGEHEMSVLLKAINEKNVPGVMTCALILSAVFMLAMVCIDICFALIDPKVKARYQ